MRHPDAKSILTPGNVEPEVGLVAGGDDWLNRVNFTINNFKELVKLFSQFKGQFGQEGDTGDRGNNPPALAKGNPGLADYIQLAINAGYGNIPLSQIIEKIAPFSLSQLKEMLKNARLKG